MVKTEQQRLGWLSMLEMAELLGINYHTLWARVRGGIFPAPKSQIVVGGRRYYDPIQVAEILRDYTEEEAK